MNRAAIDVGDADELQAVIDAAPVRDAAALDPAHLIIKFHRVNDVFLFFMTFAQVNPVRAAACADAAWTRATDTGMELTVPRRSQIGD